jgi:hypothetical protein
MRYLIQPSIKSSIPFSPIFPYSNHFPCPLNYKKSDIPNSLPSALADGQIIDNIGGFSQIGFLFWLKPIAYPIFLPVS